MSNWKIPASTIFREDLESIFLAEETRFFQKQQLTPIPELLPPGIRPGPAPPSRHVGTWLEGSGQSSHGGQGASASFKHKNGLFIFMSLSLILQT